MLCCGWVPCYTPVRRLSDVPAVVWRRKTRWRIWLSAACPCCSTACWLLADKKRGKKEGKKKSSCSPTENLEILWQPADNFQLSLIDGVSPQRAPHSPPPHPDPSSLRCNIATPLMKQDASWGCCVRIPNAIALSKLSASSAGLNYRKGAGVSRAPTATRGVLF